MKKFILPTLLVLVASLSLSAQKYYTRDGSVSFVSQAPMEKIEAKNQKLLAVLDSGSGRMEFSVLIQAFQFEKALMQEHFNENYLESGKYPKAVFKGQLQNPKSVNFKKDGSYPVKVKGQMTMHGQTKEIETEGVIKVKGDKLGITSTFEIAVADYNIDVPSVVRDKVAKIVQITVDSELVPLDK